MTMRQEPRTGVRKGPGPAPSLDRSDIVAAAVVLADDGGLPAVSMRAVAGRMGTSASALYRYVDDRAALLDLMADHVTRELRSFAPTAGGGIEAIVAVAYAQRDLYRRHPWLGEIPFRMSAAGPETLRFFDACLGALRASTASTSRKFEALALSTALAAVFASRSPLASAADQRLPDVDRDAFPHLAVDPDERRSAVELEDLLGIAVRGVLRGLLEP